MARLSKNSTVNGERIIHKDIANDHSHYLIDIRGLGTISEKDSGNGGDVYAERIHGYSLSDLYDRYLHIGNNTMQGYLKINSFTDDDSLINKQYLDQYADEMLLDDSLNSLPNTNEISIARNPNTLVATNVYGEIDRSRLDLDNIENEFKPSLNGPLQVQVGQSYVYTITNFSSFFHYDITLSDGGHIYVNNEEIILETDSSNSQDRYISIFIELNNQTYEYEIYFLQG